MDAEQLKAIKARWRGVGPWNAAEKWAYDHVVKGPDENYTCVCCDNITAAKVARAPNDIAALLAEVERLTQVSAEVCQNCGWAMQFPGEPCCKCEVERLTADLERLNGFFEELEARETDVEVEKAKLRGDWPGYEHNKNQGDDHE